MGYSDGGMVEGIMNGLGRATHGMIGPSPMEQETQARRRELADGAVPGQGLTAPAPAPAAPAAPAAQTPPTPALPSQDQRGLSGALTAMNQRGQVIDAAVNKAAGYADGSDRPIDEPHLNPATGRYQAPSIGQALAADMPHVRAAADAVSGLAGAALPKVKALTPGGEGMSPAKYVSDAVMAPGGQGGLLGLGRQITQDAGEALGKAAYESAQGGSAPRKAAGLVAGITAGALTGPDSAAEMYRKVSGQSAPSAPPPAAQPRYQGASMEGKDDGQGGPAAAPAAAGPGLARALERGFPAALPGAEAEAMGAVEAPPEPAKPRAGGIVRDRKMGIEYRIGDQESGYPISKTIQGQPVAMGGGGTFSVMGGGRNVNPDGSYTYLSADGRGVFTRAPDKNGQLGEILDYRSAGTDAADQAALRAGFGDAKGYRAAQAAGGASGVPMVQADTRAVDQALAAFRQRNPNQASLTAHGQKVLESLLKQRADIIQQANESNVSLYNNALDRTTAAATAGMTDARERELAGLTDARERQRMALDTRRQRPEQQIKQTQARALKQAIADSGGDVVKGIARFQRAMQPPRSGGVGQGAAQIVSLPNPVNPAEQANYQMLPNPEGGVYAAPIPVRMTPAEIAAKAAQDAEASGHTPGFLGFGREAAERWQQGRAQELAALNPGNPAAGGDGSVHAVRNRSTGQAWAMVNGRPVQPVRGMLGTDPATGRPVQFDGAEWVTPQ